jgi:hypothetical protein
MAPSFLVRQAPLDTDTMRCEQPGYLVPVLPPL